MNIPTAEELAEQMDESYYKDNNYYQSKTEPEFFASRVAIEFAKLHIQEALKAAGKQADNAFVGNRSEYINNIINSYPLTNIK